MSKGLLSIVGTPIGNLSDISERMKRTLAEADSILCEDTRVSAKLMAHLGLHTPLERCDENVIASRVDQVLARLEAGEHLALISDAGMPAISDPGQLLVDAVLDAGLQVEVVPGPSAVIAAVALSGLDSSRFLFAGFLPRKSGELRRSLEKLAEAQATLVVYESPKRVEKTLQLVAEVFGESRVALVREITKLHEEVLRGRAQELIGVLQERGELKGECVLVIEPAFRPLAHLDQNELDNAIQEGLLQGESTSVLAKRLAHESGLAKSAIYARIVELSKR